MEKTVKTPKEGKSGVVPPLPAIGSPLTGNVVFSSSRSRIRRITNKASAAWTTRNSNSSLLSLRGNQSPPVLLEGEDDRHRTDDFQKLVTDTFSELAATSNENVLSLTWLLKLLNSFIYCHEHFTSSVLLHRPKRTAVADLFDRSLKALDLCIAVGDSLDHLYDCHSHVKIIGHALSNPTSAPHIASAKKELTQLIKHLSEDVDAGIRPSSAKGGLRSLLQGMGGNLVAPPRSFDNHFAVNAYTMNCVLVFVMWVLVVSIASASSATPPLPSVRQFEWAAPMTSLQERILEEWKKRGKEGSNVIGLMEELQMMERFSKSLKELLESSDNEIGNGMLTEIRDKMIDLEDVSKDTQEGVKVFRRQVREAFHRIIKGRNETVQSLVSVRPHTHERSTSSLGSLRLTSMLNFGEAESGLPPLPM